MVNQRALGKPGALFFGEGLGDQGDWPVRLSSLDVARTPLPPGLSNLAYSAGLFFPCAQGLDKIETAHFVRTAGSWVERLDAL
jgi:hypothetical protein